MTLALILVGALVLLVAPVGLWAALATAFYLRAKRANTAALFWQISR